MARKPCDKVGTGLQGRLRDVDLLEASLKVPGASPKAAIYCLQGKYWGG